MLNLLRADFYKLFHIKSFYVVTIILLAFVTIVGASFKTIDNLPENKKQELIVEQEGANVETDSSGTEVNDVLGQNLLTSGIDFAFIGLAMATLINLLTGIMVSLGIGGEFKERTIKSMVAKGYRRELVVLSKIIVYVVATFIMLMITMLYSFFIGWILSGNIGSLQASKVGYLVKMLLAIFGIYFAYSSVATLITFAIRNVELAVVMNVLVLFFVPMVLDKLEDLFKIQFSELRLDIACQRLTGSSEALQNSGINSSNLQHAAVLVIGYIAVSVIGSCLIFKRVDVK